MAEKMRLTANKAVGKGTLKYTKRTDTIEKKEKERNSN